MLIPTPLPQLDRAFDYAVPDDLRSAVSFGVRVRVRFAGRLATGFVVEIKDDSDFKLQPIRSVLGPSVLTPELLALSRAVAERWVGTLGMCSPPPSRPGTSGPSGPSAVRNRNCRHRCRRPGVRGPGA